MKHKLIRHIKKWNKWRKHNLNGRLHKFLVLIGVTYSLTYEWMIVEDKILKERKNEIIMNNILIIIITLIYTDLAIFISVYVYCKALKGYEIFMIQDNKKSGENIIQKTKNQLKIQSALIGIFFPFTVPVLAAILVANK